MTKNDFPYNATEQINILLRNSSDKQLRVSYILSQLDFSHIIKKENNFSFTLQSISRLYVFRHIKGFNNYHTLAEYLYEHEDEAFQIGFFKNESNHLQIPPKRTYNNYLLHLDKSYLNTIAEKILSTATLHGVLLDLPIVKHAIQDKKKSNEREIREAIRLVKKLVYPLIDIKIKENGKFTTKDLLDVLVHVAFTNDFANNGSVTFHAMNEEKESPSGDLMMYHFSKFNSIYQIQTMFEKISDFIFNFARSNYNILRNRKHDIAYDIHKVPYYGKGITYACGDKYERGTSNFLEFLTCSIVVAGRRFVVDVVPIHPLDEIHKLLDRSLQRVRNKIKIERAYLDRGFNEANIFRVLKQHRIKFLMPMTRTTSVKEAFDKAQYTKARIFHDWLIGREGNKEAVNLILVDDELGIKRAFVCNFDIAPCIAYRLYGMYSKRWGIETGYRNLDHDFQARTTTRNYHIRLFYFLFSTCLYNLWVLVNIVVSLTLYGRVKDKPIVTAKLFAVILYQVREGHTDHGG